MNKKMYEKILVGHIVKKHYEIIAEKIKFDSDNLFTK